MEPKNCIECKKNKSCRSWYGGTMCTEVKGSMYNRTKEARGKWIGGVNNEHH